MGVPINPILRVDVAAAPEFYVIEYLNAHGITNVNDVVAQQSMFADSAPPEWSDRAVALAKLIRDAKPNAVVAAFRKYVNSKEPTMFGESTPQEAFDDAFGGGSPETILHARELKPFDSEGPYDPNRVVTEADWEI